MIREQGRHARPGQPGQPGQRALRSLRLTGRVLVIAALCSTGLAIVMTITPFGLVARRPMLSCRRFIYRTWARAMNRVLSLEVRMVGTPPELPCLLVSNHLSYVDILVLATRLPARFVAKSEVRSWPIVGWMCRAVDTIFVNRTSRRDVLRVSGAMANALGEGDGVILFPEGTSTRGDRVAPFKGSLLAPAAEADLPVWAAAIRYETPRGELPADLSVAWWGGMEFLPHVRTLLGLSSIIATVHWSEAPCRNSDRKALARDLEARVAALFVPMTDEPTPFDPALPAHISKSFREAGDAVSTEQR